MSELLYDIRGSSAASLFILIALFFLGCSVLIILTLFASRLIKSSYKRRASVLRFQCQKILNAIVIHELYSTTAQPVSAFEYRLGELRLLTGHSGFAQQVLIDSLLELKKNLSGASARALIVTYYELNLHQRSVRKLRSFLWKRRAQGIRELSEMGHRESIPAIMKFVNTGEPILRQESVMALVRLADDNPLFFLDDYHQDFTMWMRINIYYYLTQQDVRKLPVFSRWFTHSNTSIVLFCISMVRQFRQTESLPELSRLLSSPDVKVVTAAVQALGEMEAYQYAADVIALTDRAWNDEKLSRRLVRCLGMIGDAREGLDAIIRFLSHPVYSVYREAALALRKLGPEGQAALTQFNADNDGILTPVIRHIEEPLLQ